MDIKYSLFKFSYDAFQERTSEKLPKEDLTVFVQFLFPRNFSC